MRPNPIRTTVAAFVALLVLAMGYVLLLAAAAPTWLFYPAGSVFGVVALLVYLMAS